MSLTLLMLKSQFVRGLLLAGLVTQLVLYNLGRTLIGARGPCACLGSTWVWLGISDHAVSTVTAGLAFYVLGAGILLAHWGNQP
jgi:hypothetical protein